MNVVMIQPMVDRAAAFCLLSYGIENKFSAVDVSRRWKYINETLASHGFNICGVSGDGDSRILKTMKAKSGLSRQSYIYAIGSM